MTRIHVGTVEVTIAAHDEPTTGPDEDLRGIVTLGVMTEMGAVMLSLGRDAPMAHAFLDNNQVRDLLELLVNAVNANGGTALLQVHRVAVGEAAS